MLRGGQGGEQQQSKGAEGGLDVGAGSSSPILPGGCEVPGGCAGVLKSSQACPSHGA